MNSSLIPRLVTLCVTLVLVPSAQPKQESLSLFYDLVVAFEVPEGFTYSRKADSQFVTVTLTHASENLKLVITFFADPGQRMLQEEMRQKQLTKVFQKLAPVLREKTLDFKNLDSPLGRGTYLILTDAKLMNVSRTERPPGEYVYSTTGIRAGSGCFFLFQLLSHDLTSKPYQLAMQLVREGFVEQPIVPTL